MRTIFDLLQGVPLARGVLAILIGWGVVYLGRTAFYRVQPPVTLQERSERVTYWIGRVIGFAIIALGVIMLALELFLLCCG